MGSDLVRVMLLTGLLPGLVVGVGLLLVWGLLSAESAADSEISPRRLRWGVPLLFFVGYVSIVGAIGSLDASLWPKSVPGRVLALGGLALGVSLVDALSPWRTLAWVVRFVGGGAVAWVISSVLHPHLFDAWDVAVWVALGGLVCALGVWLQEGVPVKHAWVAPAQGVLVVSGLMGLVYWSGLAPSSMQVGGVQGMLVTASLAGAILGRISLARGGWTFIGVLLVGYIALARVLGSGVVPPLAFTLVLSGIGSGTLGRILARKVRRGFIAGTVALTLTALPVAGGAWIGWRAYDAPEVEHDDSLDDDDSDGVYYTDDE